MSTVTVQLGQCGNQMGAALFDVLAGEAAAGPMDFRREVTESFFREAKSGGSLVARAALVDMEPKARKLKPPRAALPRVPGHRDWCRCTYIRIF